LLHPFEWADVSLLDFMQSQSMLVFFLSINPHIQKKEEEEEEEEEEEGSD